MFTCQNDSSEDMREISVQKKITETLLCVYSRSCVIRSNEMNNLNETTKQEQERKRRKIV